MRHTRAGHYGRLEIHHDYRIQQNHPIVNPDIRNPTDLKVVGR